ncbi:MAG: DUF4434 domain-containing protein [Acetivibrionales bacterium]|jgi:hypothetical protein
MFKRFLALLLAILLLFISKSVINKRTSTFNDNAMTAARVNIMSESRQYAVADGTFIQWWLVKDWDDTRWLQEFSALRKADMHYVVLAPTAFYIYDRTTGEGKTHTLFPTETDGFEVLKDEKGKEYGDIVDACLRNAEKADIKVFLGLNTSDDWWMKRLDSKWVYARMEEGNKVADELWDRYYHKYPSAFYGWYWDWEVDNFYFSTADFFKTSRKLLADAIKIHMDHFDKTEKHLPFMLAPFMDWRVGRADDYARMWEYVFKNSGMKVGDIFCPQDCIGAGGLNIDNLADWFAGFRKAVDKVPGLKLWADIETFDDRDWTAATLDRFVSQMEKVRPYVDNYITFSYSHYYSPYNVDPGFHKTYIGYLMTGELEPFSPTKPENLVVQAQSPRSIYLSWQASEDNIGVAGYYVYRNGVLVSNIQVKRKDNTFYNKEFEAPDTFFKDLIYDTGATYTYEVQAYDFAGNISEKTDPVSITVINPATSSSDS